MGKVLVALLPFGGLGMFFFSGQCYRLQLVTLCLTSGTTGASKRATVGGSI